MDEEKEAITKSLNEMLDSKDIEHMKLASGIIKNQPDLVEEGILKWYKLEEFIDPNESIKLAELYSSEGSSDKVYIINLRRKPNYQGFTVIGYYGRRGKSLRSDIKYNGTSITSAEDIFDEILSQKEGKGYKNLNK